MFALMFPNAPPRYRIMMDISVRGQKRGVNGALLGEVERCMTLCS